MATKSVSPRREAFERWQALPARIDETGLHVGDQQVIQYWERPVMEAMGRVAAARGGDVLEIGFGLGLSAAAVRAASCRSYTLIEAHPEVAVRARRWTSRMAIPATLLEGFWQDEVGHFANASFDGILFDPCPVSEDERDVWYRAFFEHASRLLRPGGAFTYFSHQSAPGPLRDWPALARGFSDIQAVAVPISPATDCQYWSADSVLVPIVRR